MRPLLETTIETAIDNLWKILLTKSFNIQTKPLKHRLKSPRKNSKKSLEAEVGLLLLDYSL